MGTESCTELNQVVNTLVRLGYMVYDSKYGDSFMVPCTISFYAKATAPQLVRLVPYSLVGDIRMDKDVINECVTLTIIGDKVDILSKFHNHIIRNKAHLEF